MADEYRSSWLPPEPETNAGPEMSKPAPPPPSEKPPKDEVLEKINDLLVTHPELAKVIDREAM